MAPLVVFIAAVAYLVAMFAAFPAPRGPGRYRSGVRVAALLALVASGAGLLAAVVGEANVSPSISRWADRPDVHGWTWAALGLFVVSLLLLARRDTRTPIWLLVFPGLISVGANAILTVAFVAD